MTETVSRSAVTPVFQMMYRSRNRLTADDRGDELADLFARSRSNNQRRGITGALLVSGQWFVQVLEGDQAVVQSLFDTIRTDARHEGVEVLWTEPAGSRVFGQWSMAQVGVPDSDLPLIARISEITPGSHMTAEKKRLLDTMRQSLDDGSSS